MKDRVLTEEQELTLAKLGRVLLGQKTVPELVELKNIRYVYNPNPYLVHIPDLGVSVRPGELVDLVMVVGNAEKVMGSRGVSVAVESKLLKGFSKLEEIEMEKLEIPKPSPVEELKESGLAIGPEGIERVVEEVKPIENPFTERLDQEYEREEEEIERLSRRGRRKQKK